jgi:hypothetical protein
MHGAKINALYVLVFFAELSLNCSVSRLIE